MFLSKRIAVVDNQPVTDLSYLREIAMGDEEIVIETTKAFLADAPGTVQNMLQHFAHKEWSQLYKQAHKIKPNLNYMGMERAYHLIIGIEQQAKSGNILEDFEDMLYEFNRLCTQGFEELSTKIAELE